MRRWLTVTAYGALCLGALTSGFSLSALLDDVVEETATIRSSGRDDVVWQVNQYRFELSALIRAIDAYYHGWGDVTIDDVRDRLDVLWGRVDATGQGVMGRILESIDGAEEVVDQSRAALQQVEAIVVGGTTVTEADLARVTEALYALEPALRNWAYNALDYRHSLSAGRASRFQARTEQIGLLSAGMALCAAAVVVLLLFERSRISRLRNDLARRFRDSTEALRQSEQRFRRLTESAPEAVVVLDVASGTLVEANESAETLFGLEPDRLIGARPHELSPAVQPDGRRSEDAAKAYLEQAIRGETPTFEWMHLHSSGREVPCEIRLVAMPSGTTLHVRGSMIDISERQRTERELARYRQELEALVEERTDELVAAQRELLRTERLATIGELTGTVSHELRNPLGTISTNFRLLRYRLDTSDQRIQRSLERIERNIGRCVKIIDELLDFARIRDLSPTVTDVDPWLASVLAELSAPAAVALQIDLDANASARMDPERMRQVVVNLVENAFHATSEGLAPEARGTVTVRSRASEDAVHIEVEDTGPGIAPGDRERIFEPLFSTRSFGIGLGLPLVRRIVEQHDATIEVCEGQNQQGTRFIVNLARVEGLPSSESEAQHPPAAPRKASINRAVGR